MEQIKETIIKKFLMQCLVVDTESTGLDPQVAEICEIGTAITLDGITPITKDKLFGTELPIPFAASSKNNISRKMIADLPKVTDDEDLISKMLHVYDKKIKYYVAHNFKYDKELLTSTFGTRNDRGFEEIANRIMNTRWLCTYRLAQHLFKPSEEDPNLAYALNYLRYAFDLPVEGTVHRAGDDSRVTWFLLQFIAEYYLEAFQDDELDESFDLGEQLFELSKIIIKIDVMPFGKHKGEKLSDVPDSYYKWMLEKSDMLNESSEGFSPDFAESVLEELNRRQGN